MTPVCRTALHVATALAVLLPQPSAHAVQPGDWEGDWQLVGDPAELAGRERAIAAVAGRLPWPIRGIARRRLDKGSRPEAWLEFRWRNDALQGRGSIHGPWTTPVDGRPVDVRGPGGETVRLSRVLRDDELIETGETDEGRRTNHYRLTPDGRTLRVQMTIASPRLPVPLKYGLTYRRK